MRETAADVRQFTAAWETFFRAARRVRGRDAARTADSGLSLAQYHLVEALGDGPQPVGALAAAAGVTPPTATRMLDGLARDGLIERRPSARDRRSVDIELTPAGETALARKRRDVAAVRRRVAASLSEEERRAAAKLMVRLAEAMEDL